MKEKEKLIIEEAMKLFAKKGFSQTSVQEIADEAGISKGAFYIYFKSKEELMISIFNYYYNRLQNKIISIDKEDLLPREKFAKQLFFQFEEIEKYKDFIIMQARERSVPFNSEIEMLMNKMEVESLQFYKRGLLEIYGERIMPFIWDLIVSLQGIFHSYLRIIIFDMALVDTKQVVTFILNRADDFVNSLEGSDESSVLSTEKMDNLLGSYSQVNKEDLLKIIKDMKSKLSNHPEKEHLFVTLDVLHEELQKENPRLPVIEGMSANLSHFPALHYFRDKVEAYLKRNTLKKEKREAGTKEF